MKINDTVELIPEMKVYFKEMMQRNPQMKTFCSFRQGVVVKIEENEILDAPNVVTVHHDNGKTYQYQECHLKVCENNDDNIVIRFVGVGLDIEKKGNTKSLTIGAKSLTILANGKEHHISFDSSGNMIILK